jgi:hypothetical protein
LWLILSEARLAAQRQDWPAALDGYQAALQAWLPTGDRWHQAWTVLELAHLHQARHWPGDDAAAQALRQQAAELFDAHGAPSYAARLRSGDL